MTAKETIAYLDTLSLVEALWWFIENLGPDDNATEDVFFYLRARYRNEEQT